MCLEYNLGWIELKPGTSVIQTHSLNIWANMLPKGKAPIFINYTYCYPICKKYSV